MGLTQVKREREETKNKSVIDGESKKEMGEEERECEKEKRKTEKQFQ